MEGRVKWFNEKKGFGFIRQEGKDIFVHFTQIEEPGARRRSLETDQLVSFDLVMDEKGPQARNVRKV